MLESTISLFWLGQNVYGYDYKRPVNFLEYIVIILIFVVNVDRKELVQKVVYAYLFSAFLFLGLTLLKSIGLDIPGFERNTIYELGIFKYGVTAIFGATTSYSSFVLPLIPAIVVSIEANFPLRMNKMLLFFLMVATIFLISLNGSRGTLIAILGSVFISYYLAIKFQSDANRLALEFKKLLYVSCVLIFSLIIFFNIKEIYSFASNIRNQTIESRFVGYKLGIDLIFENYYYLLLGAGKERFVQDDMALFEKKKVVLHNTILEETVADGVFGMVLMAAFFYNLILLGIDNIRHFSGKNYDKRLSYLSIVLLAAFFSILFEGIFANITPEYSLWIMIAVICSLANISRKEALVKSI